MARRDARPRYPLSASSEPTLAVTHAVSAPQCAPRL
jgi:hypothetical protein